MENTLVTKPIFWRLLIWVVVPMTLACIFGNLLYQITQSPSRLTVNWSVVTGFAVGATFIAIMNRRKYDIVIAEGKVSGIGTGFVVDAVTFPITEFDKASINQRSIFERMLGYHTLRSTKGQKIMFVHFIYGQAAVNRVYDVLDKQLS